MGQLSPSRWQGPATFQIADIRQFDIHANRHIVGMPRGVFAQEFQLDLLTRTEQAGLRALAYRPPYSAQSFS